MVGEGSAPEYVPADETARALEYTAWFMRIEAKTKNDAKVDKFTREEAMDTIDCLREAEPELFNDLMMQRRREYNLDS